MNRAEISIAPSAAILFVTTTPEVTSRILLTMLSTNDFLISTGIVVAVISVLDLTDLDRKTFSIDAGWKFLLCNGAFAVKANEDTPLEFIHSTAAIVIEMEQNRAMACKIQWSLNNRLQTMSEPRNRVPLSRYNIIRWSATLNENADSLYRREVLQHSPSQTSWRHHFDPNDDVTENTGPRTKNPEPELFMHEHLNNA